MLGEVVAYTHADDINTDNYAEICRKMIFH